MKHRAKRFGITLSPLILLSIGGLAEADSHLIGRLPDGFEDTRLYPVLFVLLDGEVAPAGASQQRMKVTPGVHSIAAVPAKIPGKASYTPDLTEAKQFAIEIQDCREIYVAARFLSEGQLDWEPEIVGEAADAKCENETSEQAESLDSEQGM